jgi:hypothetical protein
MWLRRDPKHNSAATEWLGITAERHRMYGTRKEYVMVRYGLIGFAAVTLLAASLVPGDAFARGGRGGGGGMRAGGFGGGGMRMGGGARPSHPIAGRPGGPGNPGRPIAGRPGGPVAGYPGNAWRGAGYGAAAVGAAAAGAGLYGYYNNNYNNGCNYDPNGNWICPGQYPYNGYNGY